MTRSHLKFLGLAACLAWVALPLGAQQPPKVEALTAHRMGKTPPMRQYLATHHIVPHAPYRVFPLRKPLHPGKGGGNGGAGTTGWTDPVLQSSEGSTQIGAPTANFEGMGSVGYVPPDTNISVGPNQVVETVNVDWQVYDKSGNGLLPNGPAPIHAIFQAAAGGNLANGDACASTDGGDPIVLYDKINQRWIIAQMAYNNSFTQNEYCLAISATSNATGSYYAYDLPFGSNLPDYPKLAIWADAGSGSSSDWTNLGSHAGVYFSANIFSRGSSFTGAVMCGFPLGEVAQVTDTSGPTSLSWVCAYNGTSVYSILPADIESSPGVSGTTLPAPANTAEYYVQFSGSNTLNLFQFAPNFTNGTATVSSAGNVSVATFNEACGGGACVPQLNTTNQLDSLGDRLMYRLSYRNDGTNQNMDVTQSVQNSSSSTQTGVRWYQLENTGSGWSVGQQGTFGPSDGVYRWMGSIAQDKFGDLGVGYSTSSPSSFPGMGYTGWAPGDVANTLEGEQLLSIGAGDQTSVDRWGDYSSMSIDPADDCTFWYANEYLKYAGSYTNWGTKIVSFAFPACSGTATPDYSLSASPTSQTVTAGSPTSYDVTVTPSGGFNSDVTLSVSSSPSGPTGTFSTNPVSSGSYTSTLDVPASSTGTPGTYTLTITGSTANNGPSHSIPVTLVVNGASSGGFSLSASSTSLSLTAKSSKSTTVTVNSTGTGTFNGTVTLSVSGLPHGTSASFSSSSITGTSSSTLTIKAGGHPQTGTYTVYITGTSGSQSASTTLQLTVN